MITDLSKKLAGLQNNLNTKYRATGKVDANKSLLLDNALREMSSSAHSLMSHVLVATADPDTNQQYMLFLNDYQLELLGLAQTTQALQTNYIQELGDVLARQLKVLKTIAQQIEQLPPLGIALPIDEDELFFDDSEPEDVSEELKADLSNWPARYLREMSTSIENAQNNAAAFNALQQEIDDMSQRVIAGEVILKANQQNTSTTVAVAMIIAIALLTLLVLFIYFTQRKYILVPLNQLHQAFHNLLESNDMASINNTRPNTEIGEIISYFNQLLERQQLDNTNKLAALTVVNEFMLAMSENLEHIRSGSTTTYTQVEQNQQALQQIKTLGEQVNDINQQVADNTIGTNRCNGSKPALCSLDVRD